MCSCNPYPFHLVSTVRLTASVYVLLMVSMHLVLAPRRGWFPRLEAPGSFGGVRPLPCAGRGPPHGRRLQCRRRGWLSFIFYFFSVVVFFVVFSSSQCHLVGSFYQCYLDFRRVCISFCRRARHSTAVSRVSCHFVFLVARHTPSPTNDWHKGTLPSCTGLVGCVWST